MASAQPVSASGTPWYDFSLYSDYPATSYHNTDVGTPIDTPLTAPLAGTVTNDSYQDWGGQLTIRADDTSVIGGHPYYFLIHMDAINPALAVGSHVNAGTFLGYSGGQYPGELSQYPALPTGYTHHDTLASHSTGPHLDIGVTDSPQGSMDVDASGNSLKTYSDALVTFAQSQAIPFTSDSSTVTQQSPGSSCSDFCGPCDWHSPWNWPCCAGCQISSSAGSSGGAGNPDWHQWANLAARGGFMVLGGAMVLGGVYLAVKSLGDATGVTAQIQNVTKTAAKAAAL